jgi:hypothetical protein
VTVTLDLKPEVEAELLPVWKQLVRGRIVRGVLSSPPKHPL